MESLCEFANLKLLAEPVKVLETLPKASLIVLIAAKKVGERAPIFNFEAVYTKYKAFTKMHNSLAALQKPVFLKLFVDLIHSGFLKSEGDATEVLNVNNKIALGFRERELTRMIEEAKDKICLPNEI